MCYLTQILFFFVESVAFSEKLLYNLLKRLVNLWFDSIVFHPGGFFEWNSA